MRAVPSKWLPVTRHIADAVPAEMLREIIKHERRIMPTGMRARPDEMMREAETWRERQARPAINPLGPRVSAVDARKALATTTDTPPKLASAVARAKPMPWKNPRIKRRLTPGKAV